MTDPNLVGYPADGAVLGSAWHFVIFCCVSQSLEDPFRGFGSGHGALGTDSLRQAHMACALLSSILLCGKLEVEPSQPNDEKLAACLDLPRWSCTSTIRFHHF